MKERIQVVFCTENSPLLRSLPFAGEGFSLVDLEHPPCLQNQKILFVTEADRFGNAPRLYSFLEKLGEDAFAGSVGGLVVTGDTDLYTKTLAAKIVFDTNLLGLAYVGRPLVEATGSRKNFRNIVSEDYPHEAAFLGECEKLFVRLREAKAVASGVPRKILALHAGNKHSNTLMLWHMVQQHMGNYSIREINIENGELHDCRGCSFKICTHYGEQQSCFYGGIITDEVFPAISEADAIVLICPNYNDGLSANMSALINRLTALYRTQSFLEKQVYGIIVSGYSGSDALAKQLISALNMNKSMYLPPHFALMEIANDRGEILTVPGVEERARVFAKRLCP